MPLPGAVSYSPFHLTNVGTISSAITYQGYEDLTSGGGAGLPTGTQDG